MRTLFDYMMEFVSWKVEDLILVEIREIRMTWTMDEQNVC